MSSTPTLANHWVLRLDVECDPPLAVGRIAAGERTLYPIRGGRFEGPRLAGDVLPGADVFLRRPDDVGVLDARYALRADDGTLVTVHNTGLLVPLGPPPTTPQEAEAMDFACHCHPVFEVATDSPHAWLARGFFVGKVTYPAEGRVVIDVYQLD
jgi:hypothetical protein